jgi:hypothetical protein
MAGRCLSAWPFCKNFCIREYEVAIAVNKYAMLVENIADGAGEGEI